jgi:uncharacterized membrane protein YeaQ/YmgE (transglycosylase-associated protein family)
MVDEPKNLAVIAKRLQVARVSGDLNNGSRHAIFPSWMESRHGILTNILVGIAGAFVGGELANLLNIDVFGFFRTLISATIGAIVILFIWRQIRATA